MARLPAICDTCNILFPSPVELSGGSGPHMFLGCGTRCPRCGGAARIPDAEYTGFDDTIEILAHEPFLLDRLRRLHSVVNKVVKEKHHPLQAVEKIKREAPEFNSILDKIPQSVVLAAWCLSVLANVLSFLISVDSYVNRPPSKAEFQDMFDQAIERSYESRPDVREVPPSQLQPSPPGLEPYIGPRPDLRPPQPKVLEPYRAPPKQGRNDPCACGSGTKYKYCCLI